MTGPPAASVHLRCQVCFQHPLGLSPPGKQACDCVATGGKKARGEAARKDSSHLCFSMHHQHICLCVCFPNALLQSQLKKKRNAIVWHYFDFSVSQQLLEKFISTAETSSKWKNCGSWECINLPFVGLFLYSSPGNYCWGDRVLG